MGQSTRNAPAAEGITQATYWVRDFGMSIATKIQWVDSTCNPTMGCEGCELWNPKSGVRTCYAGMLHTRFGGATKGYSPTFDELTLWPGRMAEAARWPDLTGTKRKGKHWLDDLPRLIFVSDMS